MLRHVVAAQSLFPMEPAALGAPGAKDQRLVHHAMRPDQHAALRAFRDELRDR
jgi:hypothetical protein